MIHLAHFALDALVTEGIPDRRARTGTEEDGTGVVNQYLDARAVPAKTRSFEEGFFFGIKFISHAGLPRAAQAYRRYHRATWPHGWCRLARSENSA